MTKCKGCLENEHRERKGYSPYSHECTKTFTEKLVDKLQDIFFFIIIFVVLLPLILIVYSYYWITGRKDEIDDEMYDY